MLDVIYIAVTVVFFAAMLAYVSGCAVLGRTTNRDGGES